MTEHRHLKAPASSRRRLAIAFAVPARVLAGVIAAAIVIATTGYNRADAIAINCRTVSQRTST